GTLVIGLARNSSRVFAFQVTLWFFSAWVYIGNPVTEAALRPTTPARDGPVTGPPGSPGAEWQMTHRRSNTALPLAASAAKTEGAASMAAVTARRRKGRITDMDVFLQTCGRSAGSGGDSTNQGPEPSLKKPVERRRDGPGATRFRSDS